MANLGEVTEIVNASELTLEVGSDTYIMLKDLVVHIGFVEDRTATTGAGALYTLGKGDHHFTATLVLTTPELSSLNALAGPDSDGDTTNTAWKIVAKDVSAATKTMAATGYMREYDVRKPEEGKIEIDFFIRITGNTLTIT